MTGIRRGAFLLGLVVAVLIGGGASAPAHATFADSAPLASTKIGTGTVAAPTGVKVDDWCDVYYVYATVSWKKSDSRGVSGYRISAHLSDGSTFVLAQVDAATTTATGSADKWWLQHSPRLSVTTLTTYGWTKQSGLTRVISC